MLLRVRVTLPDRPGALGQVARTLGVAGADIVQVVVLERLGGRAVDDFTVVWPGAARIERLMAGLLAIPGVQVDAVWRAIGAPMGGGHDSELLAQIAGNPGDGLATLVDAVPGLLAADWAAAVVVPADWASRGGQPPRSDRARRPDRLFSATAGLTAEGHLSSESRLPGEPRLPGEFRLTSEAEPALVYASWRTPEDPMLPEVTPLRARALDGYDGTRFAAAPFGRAGLVLLVAREQSEELAAASFHISEVDRIAQLVKAATVVIAERLDTAAQLTVVQPGAAGVSRVSDR